MKTIRAAAFAAFLLLPAATQADEPIVVHSPRLSEQAWISRLANDLNANLDTPRMAGLKAAPTGAVSVSFQCGEDGRPSALTVARRSGSRLLDNSAMRAVGKISALHPLPAEIAPGQLVRADIVFASTAEEAAVLTRRLQRDNERRMLARRPGQPRELALVVTVRSPA